MGMEIIKLGNVRQVVGQNLQAEDCADVHFRKHIVPNPPISVWMMNLTPDKFVFPWWSYRTEIDEDVQALHDNYRVSTAQSLFDLLFLSQLTRFAGKNFYVLFSGSVKTQGWNSLRDIDQKAYQSGTPCIYHLDAQMKKKILVNWVPFYQPQSIIKDPNFETLWRLFLAQQDENNEVNCMTFFSLDDESKLPKVIDLLSKKYEGRSEKLTSLVDWYGVYSTPLRQNITPMALLYTKDREMFHPLVDLEKKMENQMDQAKIALLGAPHPRTVLKFLSRTVAL